MENLRDSQCLLSDHTLSLLARLLDRDSVYTIFSSFFIPRCFPFPFVQSHFSFFFIGLTYSFFNLFSSFLSFLFCACFVVFVFFNFHFFPLQ